MTKKFADYERVNQWDLPEIVDPGRIKVCFDIPYERYHIRAFWTALYKLTLWNSWAADEDHTAREVALVWRDVLNIAMADPTTIGCGDEINCAEFTPSAMFIEWFPNNPYTEPDFVTEGYNSPAWYEATEASNLILGTQFGDIVTDISRFPPGSLPTIIPASGLPRFRINLQAPGIVTIHLLNIFAGSIAQITIDDDPLTVRFIDMDRDQIAIPFETATTTPVEVEVLGAGTHHIDVIVVSQINDSIPFLHHGGGLRKVEICGEAANMAFYELRTDPDNPCIVQQRHNSEGEWSEAFRMDNCCDDSGSFPTRITDGIIEESPDGGETWQQIDNDPRFMGLILPPRTGGTAKCDSAQSTREMIETHFDELIDQVNLGSSITALVAGIIAILAIVVSLGTLTPLIVPLAAGAFFAGSAAMTAALTETVYDTLMCLIFCNSEDDGSYTQAGWEGLRNDIAIDPAITGLARQLIKDYVTLLGSTGLSNAASYSPDATGDCDECPCETEWCFEWNFLTEAGEFVPTFGTWTLGTGWVGTTAGTGKSIFLTLAIANTEITHIEMDVLFAPRGNINTKVGTTNALSVSNVLSNTYEWNGSLTNDDITLNPSAGVTQGTSVRMTRVLMRGTGVNPFGDDNCV